MVVVEDLVKIYPGGTKAVAGINFSVSEGEFVGFLGPNGAGKSTTMKVLSTLIRKTSGRAMVAGYDVDRQQRDVRRNIGFAMQEVGLDDLAKGWDFLVLQGILYGLSRKDSERRAEELLELVELKDVAQRRVGTYSGGMRRRIDLMAALMHSPPLLFLDEPTTGLDPQSRLAIWDHLKRLNEEGITIFLTTQMMEEAERLCQRIAIIDLGKIVAEGTPNDLKKQVGGDVVNVAIGGEDGHVNGLEGALKSINEREYVEAVTVSDGTISVRVKDGGAAAPDLLRLLNEQNVAATNLSVTSPTLDDVFLEHTGRSIRAEDANADGGSDVLRPLLGLKKR